MKNFPVLIFVVSLVVASSTAVASEQKLLAKYPQADVVWLGTFGGEVEVDPALELVAARSGEVKWNFPDGMSVPEKSAVGIAAALQVQQSVDQLELTEKTTKTKIREAQWARFEKLKTFEAQVAEVEAKRAKLTLTPQEVELLGKSLATRLTAEDAKLKEEKAHITEQFSKIYLDEQLKNEIAQLNHDLEKSRLEHSELVHSVELLALQPGRLKILMTGYVRAQEIVGKIEKQGHATVRLQVVDPNVRAEPPETIRALVDSSAGERFSARFFKTEKLPGVRGNGMVYQFDVQPNNGVAISRDTAGERMVTLFKILHKPAYILPKTEFLFTNTEEIQKLGWANFIQSKFPGTKILFVGPKHIAVLSAE